MSSLFHIPIGTSKKKWFFKNILTLENTSNKIKHTCMIFYEFVLLCGYIPKIKIFKAFLFYNPMKNEPWCQFTKCLEKFRTRKSSRSACLFLQQAVIIFSFRIFWAFWFQNFLIFFTFLISLFDFLDLPESLKKSDIFGGRFIFDLSSMVA